MNKVKIPGDVYEAFQYHDKIFKSMSVDQKAHMYMSIPSARVQGPSYVLKQFAEKQPILYIKSFLYGCEPNVDPKEEMQRIIIEWLDEPYESNSREDVKMLVDKLVHHFQKQT